MAKKKSRDRSVCAASQGLSVDPRPEAALRLGFHSRYVGFDVLHESLAVLHADIHTNIFSGLHEALREVDRSIDEWEREPNAGFMMQETRQQWKPDPILASRLSSMADLAISAANPIRKWYDLGAALGDYMTCLCEDTQHQVQTGRHVVTCLLNLPHPFLEVCGIDALNCSREEDLDLEALLQRSLEQMGEEGTTPLTCNPSNSVIIRFLDAAIRTIRQTPSLQQLGGNDSLEAGFDGQHVAAPTIAPENRTKPMSFKKAAGFMGKGKSRDAAEWLSASVRDGSIPCDNLSRQSHVFDKRWFPEDTWDQILPK